MVVQCLVAGQKDYPHADVPAVQTVVCDKTEPCEACKRLSFLINPLGIEMTWDGVVIRKAREQWHGIGMKIIRQNLKRTPRSH